MFDIQQKPYIARLTITTLVIVLAVFTSHIVQAANTFGGAIAIIIHPEKTPKQLKLKPENLKSIFWRKQRYWPKGVPIKPVNLDAQHAIRASFSLSVLGSLPNAQIDYWNGQYFNGIRPPYSVKSEEAVLRYVAKTKGAIGYVDACHVDDRVKTVFWITSQGLTRQKPNQLNCQ